MRESKIFCAFFGRRAGPHIRKWVLGVAWGWFWGCLLAGTVAAGAVYGSAAQNGHSILVATSIAPLADFVRQVGGNRVEVITLVPPGASPHTYELKPSQVQKVARAGLLVLNGAGLEYWADKLVKAADNPALRVVDTSEGMVFLDEGAHGANPHLWLDVRQAMAQVERIRDALVQAAPGHAAVYRANTSRYLAQMEKLDREITQEVRGWTQHQFIAFHPAWAYFARRYGLEQAGVLERAPGRIPSPAELARIVETAKRIGVRAIFAEPQFSSKAAEAVASESGARVLFLDPLGSSLKDPSYLSLMRYNLAQMAQAMK